MYAILTVICITASFYLYRYIWIANSVVYIFQAVLIILSIYGIVPLFEKSKFLGLLYLFLLIVLSIIYYVSMELNMSVRIIKELLNASSLDIDNMDFRTFLDLNDLSLSDIAPFAIVVIVNLLAWLMFFYVQICIIIFSVKKSIAKIQNAIEKCYIILIIQSLPILIWIIFGVMDHISAIIIS